MPGKVVDSSTIELAAAITPASARAAPSSGPRSGSRLRVSGVGTQTRIASASCSSTKRVVNVQRSRTAPSRSSGMSSMCERPSRSAATFAWSTSTPMTSPPASAKPTASGRPTYPSPTMPMLMAAKR